jgi:hypothetical protein
VPVPCAPSVVRATTLLLVCAGGLTACTVASTATVNPEAPSITAVMKDRFTVPVDLDHGGLLVNPAPARAGVTVTESDADAMFEATDAVAGPHAFAIFGLGLVTVAPRVEQPPTTTTTTTTAPPPPSTVPPTTTLPPAPPPTTRPTTTTTPPTTTTAPTTPPVPADRGQATVTAARETDALTSTTVPSSTSTTVAPSTTAPLGTPSTALPTYHRRLAWVGIVWDAATACPGSSTTKPGASTSYIAVIIDARTGHRVLVYRSGGSSPCSTAVRSPGVTEPNELLSVSWQPVGPSSTAVQVDIPPCGHYYGWTQVPGAQGAVADQVVAAVPFDTPCPSTATQSQPVDQVVPLGSGQGLVGHAPVGPVQALDALPSD